MSLDDLPLHEWMIQQPERCPECGWHPPTMGHHADCSEPPANPSLPDMADIPVELRTEVARRGLEDVALPPPRLERPW